MTILDWRTGGHWSPRLGACRDCGGKTNLRDADGRPRHKLCAEHEIDGSNHGNRWCPRCSNHGNRWCPRCSNHGNRWCPRCEVTR